MLHAGKSTLLAQVGLLCVMAQAGLFVPAEGMVFHPFGNILTHLTGHKDLYSTSSSLMLEAQVRWLQEKYVSVSCAAVVLPLRRIQGVRGLNGNLREFHSCRASTM